MQMREKVGKSRNTVFFPWFVAPEGRKVGSLKRRVRSQLAIAGQMRDEQVHAVAARSTCPRKNAQNTPWSDHFWKLRCRKSARRCGAKHMSKKKCTKHTMVGPLLEVEMSKKCTPLWHEAHFEVKMCKTHQHRTTFGSWDVEKVHAVVARSTLRSQNVKSTRGSDHFWRFGCRFASLHYIALRYIPLHYTTGHYTTLHSSTLHYTTLRSSTLHYTKLHYTTLLYTEWHCTADRQVDRYIHTYIHT